MDKKDKSLILEMKRTCSVEVIFAKSLQNLDKNIKSTVKNSRFYMLVYITLLLKE
jgi:hypothetical protein